MAASDPFARKVAWAALGLAVACWTGVDLDTVTPIAAGLLAWWVK